MRMRELSEVTEVSQDWKTGWGHGCTTLIILSVTWAPGDFSKGSLSQPSLELSAAI